MKGLHVTNEQMAYLIVIILIVIAFLVSTGLAQGIVKYVQQNINFKVISCQIFGASTGDPSDPNAKCI